VATLLHGKFVRLLTATIAVLAVFGVLAAVGPLQAASASGPESLFSISISGTDGTAYFTPGHARVNVTQTWNVSSPGNYEAIQVSVDAGGGNIYNFFFAMPNGSGRRFAVGYYPWAENYPGIVAKGRPGIAVLGGPDPTCGTNSGSFEVRDIHRAGLEITRMSIVFTRWCEDGNVDIGQVQFGYPATAYNVSPKVVDWPWSTLYPGKAAPEAHPVNVRLTSSKTVTAGTPKVTGPDAADFPVLKQNCTGKLTKTGCAVWLGFTPKKAGPRHATLVVPTSAGSASVSLDGLGGIGTSTWTVTTDWPGTPDNFSMPSVSAGDPYSVISQGDGTNLWTAEFATHNARKLQPGTTYHYSSAVSPPFSMSIENGDAGCELNSGSVKIIDLATAGPDDQLARMDALLTASCKSSVPYSVTARMRFHERTDRTAPGPVKGLKAVRKGSQITLTWTKPAAADLAGIIVCWYPASSAPGIWSAGGTAYLGTGTSARFTTASTHVSIAAWTYDKTGNVSTRSVVHLS
jgi:hypothetical protein